MPALRLEVFDTAPAPDGSMQPLVEATAVAEAKVASFEQGYSAGWDDAVAAQQGDQTRIRADLARNLQSLSFTFQDARSHVLQAIRPLILEMVNRLLPEVARETLAPTLDEWVAGAHEIPGSWWSYWDHWLAPKSGKKVKARIPGEGALPALEDAPGSYVKMK